MFDSIQGVEVCTRCHRRTAAWQLITGTGREVVAALQLSDFTEEEAETAILASGSAPEAERVILDARFCDECVEGSNAAAGAGDAIHVSVVSSWSELTAPERVS